MARVTTVKTSRKDHTCGRTGHVIPKGEGYQHATPGFRGATLYRCLNHPFRPSELTTSMAAEPLRAQEDLDDELDTIAQEEPDALDTLKSAWETFKEAVTEYANAREESLAEWENGNGTLEELRDTAQAAADEADAWEPEDWDGDEEARDDEEHADHEEAMAAWTEHVGEQIEAARETAQGLEF